MMHSFPVHSAARLAPLDACAPQSVPACQRSLYVSASLHTRTDIFDSREQICVTHQSRIDTMFHVITPYGGIARSAAADRYDARAVWARPLELTSRRTYEIARERMATNAGLPPARTTPHAASTENS